jgi:hypothetical protein
MNVYAISLSKYLKKIKLSEYDADEIAESLQPCLDSKDNLIKIKTAIKKIYSFHFGYRDIQLDCQAMIPVIIKICMPLIKNAEDFSCLCDNIPKILRDLPGESEATMIGWVHTYETEILKEWVANCQTLEQLLSKNLK